MPELSAHPGNQEREGIVMAKQASACLSKSLGPTNIRTIATYQVLADLQFQSRLYGDAAKTYDKVAAMFAGVVGPRALRTISARENAGVARQYAGQSVQADGSLTAALAVAHAALGWTHPTTEDLRFHLADCRLDRRRTRGIGKLLTGLSVPVLNEGEIESDWVGRLAYEQGRLALYTGHAGRAVPLLQTAVRAIGTTDPDGPIRVAAIRNLIHTALMTETSARTIRR
jgi:hypothetical protein